jgi:glycosyltransferase involved in cell wall biosynthesis
VQGLGEDMGFSLILLNYNDSRYLINWINKFYQSTHLTELIVVDDCSTDNSMMLLKCLKLRYPQIKLIQTKKNSGPFAAFIEGVKVSSNDFVSPWSADDEMFPSYINKMSQAIKDYPFVDTFTCNAIVTREGREYRRTALPFDSYISPDYLFKISKTKGISSINVIGNVVRREHVLKCWNAGDMRWPTHFDAFYIFTAGFKTGMIILGEPLVLYRANLTGFGNSRKMKDNLYSVNKMNSILTAFPEAKSFLSQLDIWSPKNTMVATLILQILPLLPKWLRRRIYDRVYRRTFV